VIFEEFGSFSYVYLPFLDVDFLDFVEPILRLLAEAALVVTPPLADFSNLADFLVFPFTFLLLSVRMFDFSFLLFFLLVGEEDAGTEVVSAEVIGAKVGTEVFSTEVVGKEVVGLVERILEGSFVSE